MANYGSYFQFATRSQNTVMKFGREDVLLVILLPSIVVLADNNYHNTTDRHVEKKASISTLHKLWKRAIPCPKDEYSTEAHCCKFCNAGTYAQSDCTEEHGNPECQDCIEGVNFMDSINSYHTCHKCSQCDAQLGQKELHACTVLQNTVCKCSEDFFCTENEIDKFDGCTKCKHCTQCEYGYHTERCTATNDTICKPKRNHYPLIASFGVSILFLCYLWWVRRNDCTNASNHPQSYNPESHHPQPLILPDELKDIDLTDLLSAFSDNMEYSTVVRLVRDMGLTDPRIDDIKLENQSDINGQKYYLLRTWYEGHGISGAFQQLIGTLENIQKRQIAEKLIQIARSHKQQSQG